MSAIPEDANAECVGPQSDKAGKVDSCNGCPNKKDCSDGKNRGPNPDAEEVEERMALVKRKILVLSGKGGVGKSTVSSQLAWALADMQTGEDRLEVGVLDIDICGPSMPRMMGVEGEEVRKSNYGWSPVPADDNLAVMSIGFMLPNKDDPVAWRGPRKNGLIKQFLADVYWGDELDYLVVDSPPGTSDEHMSIVKYLKGSVNDGSCGALIVTTPQEIALLDVRKQINFCRKVKMPILGVVENMAGFECPCCTTVTQIYPAVTGGAEQMCKEMGVKFLGSMPLNPNMLAACERGESFLRAAKADPKQAKAAQLVQSVFDKIVASHQEMSLGMSSTSRKPKAKTSASGPCGTGCKGGNCGDCKPKAEGGGCCGGNAQGGGCCKDEPAPATDAPSSGLLKLALPALLITCGIVALARFSGKRA